MATITVSVNPKVFDKGVSAAKRLGGKYDGQSKTWTIGADMVTAAMGGDTANTVAEWLGYRGLRVVNAPSIDTRRHGGECPALFGGACECDGR